ncbi:MAG: S-adenosylmethionine:tRNA ribosyltransferase-isomerase [Bacteroidetes bacterium]|nr:S-adenosylmethionine:tRNA ribosyltransferase-isomerase [Bacteroidota bacterium]
MTEYKNISIDDFNYELPEGFIASHPLPERDSSKLLVCKNGAISEDVFNQIHKYLPEDSLLVFNDTKVVQARIEFYKNTGARLEVFCLQPAEGKDVQVSLSKCSPVKWKCLVGNAKKWKDGFLEIKSINENIVLRARQVGTEEDARIIEFSWEPASMSFAEILDHIGKTPLPPYIDRNPVEEDKSRYQTIYASKEGSVAAPTAGLHFTSNVLSDLHKKNIQIANLTLHVGAGTFKPVSAKSIGDHSMHSEEIYIDLNTLLKLKQYSGKTIICVGTTSVRTLESLYWWGVKLIEEYIPDNHFFELSQWFPYKYVLNSIDFRDALDALIDYLQKNNLSYIKGKTELIIVPGYEYKTTKILITNFHQPKSTLLLLVAAFVGNVWKEAYQYAVNNKFRFLSYGDSCLFFKSPSK